MTPKVAREARPSTESAAGSSESVIPARIRQEVSPWIDVDEVGEDGFWTWFLTVLPLLRPPSATTDLPRSAHDPEARVRELARDLIDCAGDRAHLIVASDRYFRDNQILSVRVRALEAALRTRQQQLGEAVEPEDAKANDATDRYIPRR